MPITISKNNEFAKRLIANLREQRHARRSSSYAINHNDERVSVYEILPSNCLRKSYYARKRAEPATETAETIFYYVKGKATENIITRLANLGITQQVHEKEGIIGITDIIDDIKVIEIKDTTTGKRLDFYDNQFKGYLMHLLYYMVLTEKEEGILAINYSNKELVWHHKDEQGYSWFYRPPNAKPAGIESWEVLMPKDDPAREALWQQMMRRKEQLLQVIRTDDVTRLPRVRTRERNFKCSGCPFYDRCMNKDGETEEALAMANDLDLLQVSGFIHHNTTSSHAG